MAWLYACGYACVGLIHISQYVTVVGMYLSDITFIEEGSSDFLPLDPKVDPKIKTPKMSTLVNFGKR